MEGGACDLRQPGGGAAHRPPGRKGGDIAYLIHSALVTIGQLVRASPRVNGNGVAWKKLADKAEAEKVVLRKHMDGKALFTAILRLYAATHREMLSCL
jgi:hypothetical protein